MKPDEQTPTMPELPPAAGAAGAGPQSSVPEAPAQPEQPPAVEPATVAPDAPDTAPPPATVINPSPAEQSPPNPVIEPTVSGQVVAGSDTGAVPMASPAAAPIQDPAYAYSTSQPGSGGRKRLLQAGGGLLGLLLVAVIVLAVMHFLSGNITYSAKDLVTAQTPNYSISYPKQWTDVSSNQKLLTSIGASTGSFSNNIKAYAYKINKAGNDAQSLLVSGDQSSGLTDGELNQLLQDPTQKQGLTTQFTQSFNISNPGDVGCKSVTNQKVSVAYNTKNYIVQAALSYDCTPSSSQNNPILPYHVAAIAGFKNNKIFLAIIASQQSDWKRNTAFYQNDLLPSLQPK